MKGTGESGDPRVTLIMAVRNEEAFISRSLAGAVSQDYPCDRLEIVIADGMSIDRTREIIKSFQARHSNLRLIENPGRIVSTGLNLALEHARGDVIIRLDGHCEYPPDYVRQVVQLREQTGADSAGGVLVPVGRGYVQRAICAAFYSPIGVGGGALRGHVSGETVREVDSVHGGCWLRERLLVVGRFDEEMVRNQDDELSFRLRKSSGRIVQSLRIRVKYYVRDSLSKLFLQFAQYGYWKVKVIERHPKQASMRHFVPAVFIAAVAVSGLGGVVVASLRHMALGLVAVYLLALAVAAAVEARAELRLWPGIVAALATMHAGYGIGFLVGWTRRICGPLPTDAVFERLSR